MISESAFQYEVSDNVEIKGYVNNFTKTDLVLENKINDNLKVELSTGFHLNDFVDGKAQSYHGVSVKVGL